VVTFYLSCMEFNEILEGNKYSFSYIAKNLFLVTGADCEYILYKTNEWKCAEEVPNDLLEKLGYLIDKRFA
jgi:hypothetical protein